MVDDPLRAVLAALAVLAVASLAEWIHLRRVRRLSALAFGPSRRAAPWARLAPGARSLALAALAWGLVTLMAIEPRRFAIGEGLVRQDRDYQHALLVLDVSPSMRLVDAGKEKDRSRMQRARELMESFFDRVPIERFRVSVVAFYNGAKPVVIDTTDFEVVRNILGDLPMHYAFRSGRTKLFEGLEEAARIAAPWEPQSATVILLTDGDTVPATGMPRMPASVRSVLVVGVGDPQTGKFIDGRQSRQDVPTLKQVAARLGGVFHNGNTMHLSSRLIAEATGMEEQGAFEQLTRREYALLACALGAGLLAMLPLLLHFLGTRWRPGASAGAAPRDSRGPREVSRAAPPRGREGRRRRDRATASG